VFVTRVQSRKLARAIPHSGSAPAFEATFCPPRAALHRASPHPAGAAGRNPARNRLEPKPTWPPALSGETWPRTQLTPGPTPPWTKIRDIVFGALTEVTAGGSSAPISWWDGANRQVVPRRPHGGGRILSTCTLLFAVERSCRGPLLALHPPPPCNPLIFSRRASLARLACGRGKDLRIVRLDKGAGTCEITWPNCELREPACAGGVRGSFLLLKKSFKLERATGQGLQTTLLRSLIWFHLLIPLCSVL
jgi:hypothetical protein